MFSGRVGGVQSSFVCLQSFHRVKKLALQLKTCPRGNWFVVVEVQSSVSCSVGEVCFLASSKNVVQSSTVDIQSSAGCSVGEMCSQEVGRMLFSRPLWVSTSLLVVQSSAGCSVGEMCAEELGHAECLDLLLAEDRLHHLVGGEPLLVLGVLGRKNLNI